MSFLKITDPSKRAAIVDEYLKLKKSIQQNSLSEKLGDSDTQRDLIKLYKPITESQAGIAKELSDTSTALKALPESISSTLQAIMPTFSEYPSSEFSEHSIPEFSQHPSIEAIETKYQDYGPLAAEYLRKYLPNKDPADTTFGIRMEGNREYIGTLPIEIHDDDITVKGKTYTGTRGLWELLARNEPDDSIYNSDDLKNYEEIMVETNAMCAISKTDGTRILNKPGASKSYKYREIIKQMWHRNKPKKGKTGKGVAASETSSPAPIILPSDPNTLVDRLTLLMNAYEAGNTGVADEAIAICDVLLREGSLDKESYKEFITQLNRIK